MFRLSPGRSFNGPITEVFRPGRKFLMTEGEKKHMPAWNDHVHAGHSAHEVTAGAEVGSPTRWPRWTWN